MTKHPPLAGPGLFDPALLSHAARDAVLKLDPRRLAKSPVIFVTAIIALLASVYAAFGIGDAPAPLIVQIAAWLWATVLFANFAEAMAEGRGKARADSLRATQAETMAKRLAHPGAPPEPVSSRSLHKGDLVRIDAGDTIPADGEVVEGVASVDESAITGESAPVIREEGGDRSAVTGGTRVVSDHLVVRVTQAPGEGFLDRMIALVEGADRRKTPNEVALSLLLTGLTIIFVLVVVTLEPFAIFSGETIPTAYLLALFVTLIPTTIGGLLSAIGIAGMDRLVKENVIAKSGRAVEAAGDVDTLLIDKTGTITYGARQAETFYPAEGVEIETLIRAARLASLGDETAEGKSIVALAERMGMRGDADRIGTLVPFTAETRLSGIDLADGRLRKGATDAIARWLAADGGALPDDVRDDVERIARAGGTPLVVAQDRRALGTIYLKDVVKPGIKARFAELRAAGVRTVMITGDNPLTAAAIAAEAGVDDYVAEATPEKKLDYIRATQADGHLIAMCGDGSNDAPALAQADVGVAMNDGTPAAKEAANLIDLDSDPTKLMRVVEVGKGLLISRGALTTFSLANDVAKYFAIIPALFLAAYPQLQALNIMRLGSPGSAILSAVIFNAVVIVVLIPLALKGVAYRPMSAAALLRRNLLIYGLGGLLVPFVGIKLIDMAVTALGLA
ncbi:potassium-transporting ATPase subunit KdpB [Acuticoccus sp. M5D2P5]|uniref:potassium-transporting ATPase subunit KdpB n=1 Tax=Acuticoccus kalidii TaxID=2910977 RepID=UPI001F390F97|nr:potassium-transporting ATPase subunit KdpB [Acuticoccus kalidii]MCF3933711.1 potassium-transporting ATPase subunit KdpB [Acuticoccus kalidii]